MLGKRRLTVALLVVLLTVTPVDAQWPDPPGCPYLCMINGPDWVECIQRLYISGDMSTCTEVCLLWPVVMCWCHGNGCIEV